MGDNAVLSQREIDALLNADAEPGEADAPAPPPIAAVKDAGRRIKPYDFRHPEKLSKEQLRGLQIIQQAVASSMAASFSTRLRAPAEARLSALERGIYEEFVSQIGTSSVVVTIDMNPLQGYAVAAFGLDVAYGIIERLLGGRGKGSPRHSERDLTDIELALIRHVGMDIATSLVEPWSRITELAPDVAEIGVGSQVLHIIPPNEFVITAWYEIRLAEQTGGISICFPLTVLEQVLPSLSGHNLFDSRSARESQKAEVVEQEQLLPLRVPLRARLGSARLPAVDIAHLEPGDVIVLDQTVDQPLRASVGRRELFAGSPGTRGKRLAFRVTGLVDDDGWVRPFSELPS